MLVAFYRFETWFLTLRKPHLRVFENRMMRRIFGHKRVEITENWGKNCIMRTFINCTSRQILLGLSHEDETSRVCSMHGREQKRV
jgi:hypothetical protein